jgi:hypothetical protein
MGPDILAGERPLLAFVSSVMRPELQWARDATVEALTKNPTLVPWAFEYTPASSESADASYLSNCLGRYRISHPLEPAPKIVKLQSPASASMRPRWEALPDGAGAAQRPVARARSPHQNGPVARPESSP